ncbi:hypothetical protein [Actinacidiphila acidipaludis]|uniref:Uncharacterized protein n=1 Tax=Actinacidiphila acidipaludis TaxID=2873382 RepID=A0ABS7QMM5_9ACTN|nr:hypothetical protein [Streptomyces acidipaludis]MBY8883049.1 hypothetical protein [Streptomyces acidipaludis]
MNHRLARPSTVRTGVIALTALVAAAAPLTGSVAVADSSPAVPAAATAAVTANKLASLHARDASGVLWQYQGTGNRATPFAKPTRVGGGWNAYTSVTTINGTAADGSGDVVARDTSGVLWYYRASGRADQPFAPRVRVGAGWNAYTAIFGSGGYISDPAGSGDLLARDASGDLWLYRATGIVSAPFAPRVRVGWGWNAYTAITTFGNGVLARDASGVLWSYSRNVGGDPAKPLGYRVRVGAGWNAYTSITGIRSPLGTDAPGLVARDPQGRLWLYTTSWSMTTPNPDPTLIGSGWQMYTAMF